MSRSLTILVLFAFLSGCGETYVHVRKAGVTQDQIKKDQWFCKQQSMRGRVMATGGVMVGGSSPDKELYKECMGAQGYEVWETIE